MSSGDLRKPLFEKHARRPPPEESANILSRLFLAFLWPLYKRAATLDDAFTVEDLDDPILEDESERCADQFSVMWKEELLRAKGLKQEPSLFRCFVGFLKWDMVYMSIWSLFQGAAPFTNIILLRYITEFVLDKRIETHWGYLYGCISFVSIGIIAIAQAQMMRHCVHASCRGHGAITGVLFQHMLHLTVTGRTQAGGVGGMINVMSSDVMRIVDMGPLMSQLLLQPAQTIGVFAYLFYLIGWPALGGLAVFCIAVPFNYRISNSFLGKFIEKMIIGDKRVQKVQEIINAIRVVKFYAWEKAFQGEVGKLRNPEVQCVGDLHMQIAKIMFSVSFVAPLIQLVMFVILSSVYPERLTVTLFFQSMSLISILTLNIIMVPLTYSAYLQMMVSVHRIQNFLSAEAMPNLCITSEGFTAGHLQIVDATLQWPAAKQAAAPSAAPKVELDNPLEHPPMFRDMHFEAKSGELIMVVGPVGSGKTSLLASFLSEMELVKGSIQMGGKVAYVPQLAWILNASVRNNIIMHLPYDEARYNAIIEAVDLKPDIAALPNGELTEIGEKGINISGGQKQRISLARAVYTDADIYLLDDPLSAVDAHVGAHIFRKTLQGLLKNKTRILVTHQLSYLKEASRVYLVNAGKVSVETDLNAPSDPFLPEESLTVMQKMLQTWHANEAAARGGATPLTPGMGNASFGSDRSGVEKKPSGQDQQEEKKGDGGGVLVQQETRERGSIRFSTYFGYLASFGGFFTLWLPYVFFQCLQGAMQIFAQLWMGYFAEGQVEWMGYSIRGHIGGQSSVAFYLGIYAALVGCVALCVLIRETLWRLGSVRPSKILYDRMLGRVLRAPLSFFDTTPTGRILNRFTKDFDDIDFMVPLTTNQFFCGATQQFFSILSLSFAVPYFAPVAVGAIILLYFVSAVDNTSLVLRRLNNVTQSPILSLFTECLQGTSSIRAYGTWKFFRERFIAALDVNHSALLGNRLLFENLKIKINFVSALMSGATIVLIAVMRNDLSPTIAAFAVTQAMGFTIGIGYTARDKQEMALAMNSVERVLQYCALDEEPEGEMEQPPIKNWPSEGTVLFREVSAQYRPGLPNVLDTLNIEIKGGEKIGVVGRTGSGKSSLLLVLFRMIPFVGKGKVFIDGADVSTLKASVLRGAMSAIPQEPVLFSGSVRNNLDPFGRFTGNDDVLWETLKMSHLKDKVESLTFSQPQGKPLGPPPPEVPIPASKLDYPITESDFSVGQRQLICLGRAIIRRAPILVMDEATSSVDVHTDKLIQETVRTAFAKTTVITVAHRLNTIMDSDRVLVLDKGKVVEFDSPANLLEQKGSVFRGLVREASNREKS